MGSEVGVPAAPHPAQHPLFPVLLSRQSWVAGAAFVQVLFFPNQSCLTLLNSTVNKSKGSQTSTMGQCLQSLFLPVWVSLSVPVSLCLSTFLSLVPFNRFWAPRRAGFSPSLLSVLALLRPPDRAGVLERPLSRSLCLDIFSAVISLMWSWGKHRRPCCYGNFSSNGRTTASSKSWYLFLPQFCAAERAGRFLILLFSF